MAEQTQLVAIVYPDMGTAAEVQAVLLSMEDLYLLNLDDVCYITKDAEGKLDLHQSMTLTGVGAISGAVLGALVGLLFLAPIAGLAVGAGVGAMTGHFKDYGIDDEFVRKLSDGMQPSTSALFVLFHSANQERVLPGISKYGGTVLQTTLSADAEQRLQAALNAGGMNTPQGSATA
jgi:uncharacterized membrane protein